MKYKIVFKIGPKHLEVEIVFHKYLYHIKLYTTITVNIAHLNTLHVPAKKFLKTAKLHYLLDLIL